MYWHNNDAATFYRTAFENCAKDYVTPDVLQQAYHIIFPEELNQQTKVGKYAYLQYNILHNLMEKNPEAIQSFMVDDFFNRYTQEKDQDSARRYMSHIDLVYNERPELVTGEHISQIPQGGFANFNTRLLHSSYKKFPEQITHNLLTYFVETSYDLLNQEISKKEPTLRLYRHTVKEIKNCEYSKTHELREKRDQHINLLKTDNESISTVFKHYNETVSDFITAHPVEELPETMISVLQPPEPLITKLIHFHNAISEYLPQNYKDPNPLMTHAENLLNNLKASGIYGSQKQLEQLHLNKLRDFTTVK